jgi:hypothetical protein
MVMRSANFREAGAEVWRASRSPVPAGLPFVTGPQEYGQCVGCGQWSDRQELAFGLCAECRLHPAPA